MLPLIIGAAVIGTGIMYIADQLGGNSAITTITANIKVLPTSCVNYPTIYTEAGKTRWNEAILGGEGTKILVPNPCAYILPEVFLFKVINAITNHFEISRELVDFKKSLESFRDAHLDSQMDVVIISFLNGELMKLNIKELLLEFYTCPQCLTEYKSYILYIPFNGMETLKLPFYEHKMLDEAEVRRLIVIDFFRKHFKKEVKDISTTWLSKELKVTFEDNSVFCSYELYDVYQYLK